MGVVGKMSSPCLSLIILIDLFIFFLPGMTEDSVFGMGDILCDPLRPIPVVRKFRAQIVVFQPPRPLLKVERLLIRISPSNVLVSRVIT